MIIFVFCFFFSHLWLWHWRAKEYQNENNEAKKRRNRLSRLQRRQYGTANGRERKKKKRNEEKSTSAMETEFGIYFCRFQVVYVLGSFRSPFEYKISVKIISGHSIYWMEIACYCSEMNILLASCSLLISISSVCAFVFFSSNALHQPPSHSLDKLRAKREKEKYISSRLFLLDLFFLFCIALLGFLLHTRSLCALFELERVKAAQ